MDSLLPAVTAMAWAFVAVLVIGAACGLGVFIAFWRGMRERRARFAALHAASERAAHQRRR